MSLKKQFDDLWNSESWKVKLKDLEDQVCCLRQAEVYDWCLQPVENCDTPLVQLTHFTKSLRLSV